MKGVIGDCLSKLIQKKYGKDKWEEIVTSAGVAKGSFLATEDIPDQDVLRLVDSACKVLGLSLQQIADAFGDFWVNEYAVKIYKPYYKGKSAREFLLNMDNVHQMVTRNIANARPPRFRYNWKDDQTLIMTYKSNRGLIDFLVGLIKGVGKYFKENLSVMKLGSDKVQIRFYK